MFMVAVERTIVLQLSDHMMPCKRFVVGTITCIKPTSISCAIDVLNNFQFTLVEENDGRILFLDILIIRKNDTFETTVYKKPKNNIYLHYIRMDLNPRYGLYYQLLPERTVFVQIMRF